MQHVLYLAQDTASHVLRLMLAQHESLREAGAGGRAPRAKLLRKQNANKMIALLNAIGRRYWLTLVVDAAGRRYW